MLSMLECHAVSASLDQTLRLSVSLHHIEGEHDTFNIES